jgi:hypothetical protein
VANLDVQFNIAKGKVGQYFANVEANSPSGCEIAIVLLELTGLEADTALLDHDTLSALLAAANNEQTTMGRKVLVAADIALTVTDASDYSDITLVTTQTWTAATGNACGKLLFCYDPAGTNVDANMIPLLGYTFLAVPDGSDIVVNDHANGLIRFT